jgi:hypothetical protein
LLAANTITLFKYTSQFSVHHGATGVGIDSDASEINYVPSELQWSSTYGAPSFAGGQWLVLHLPIFSRFGRGVIAAGNRTIAFPSTPGATETTNMAPFYGNGAGSPASRTYTAKWYWEIDF